MKVVYHKKFLKDLAKIPSIQRTGIEQYVFDVIPEAASFASLKKFEKMTGYDNYYRARFGDYRIGAFYDNGVLELRRALNRKEIYRYFP